MEDVVFNGTDKRKRQGYAEVTLNIDRVAVGARPQKAMLLTVSEEQTEEIRKNGADAAAKIAEELAAQIPTQDNMRASAAYRTHLAKALIRRALLTVTEEVQ